MHSPPLSSSSPARGDVPSLAVGRGRSDWKPETEGEPVTAAWRTVSGAVGSAFGMGPGAAAAVEEPGPADAPSASAAPHGVFEPPPSNLHHDPFREKGWRSLSVSYCSFPLLSLSLDLKSKNLISKRHQVTSVTTHLPPPPSIAVEHLSHRCFSCSLRSRSFSACSAWAFSAFSLSSFSRAARRNCSKLSLLDFTAEDGVDVDLCARLAHEPMFFSFTSWRGKKRNINLCMQADFLLSTVFRMLDGSINI